MYTAPTKTKEYCNVAAQALGLDPAGSAGHFDDAVLVETPLPWKRDIYEKAGALSQEMIDLLALWLERYKETGVYGHRPLMIAPDPDYSRQGYRRVIYYDRGDRAAARFHKTEYLVPEREAGPLVWALFEDRDGLAAFERYRVPQADKLRDILVCTHGTVDVACAKFGFPLYRHLRDGCARADRRVWRVSHFGGHVYAPTLMDMPTGHYWAYVEEAQAKQIVNRSGDVADLRGHYRGWAGLAYGFPQAAERAMWQQEGWTWFDYPKACTVLDQDADDEDPCWMELRVDFTRTDGSQGAYVARIEVTHKIETVPSTDYTEPYAYLQYGVTKLYQTNHTQEKELT